MLKCTSVNSSTSFVFEICQICLLLLLPCWCPAFHLTSEAEHTFIFWAGPSCCVSRRLRGGRTSWWSTPKTSCPFTPSTWTPLWKSSPPRAGTASRFSSCSTTSSVWTVSSCIHTHVQSFTTLSFSFEHKKTLISFCFCFAQITCAMESSTSTFRIFMLLWWLDMWIWWSPPSHSQFTKDLSESPGSL